MNNLSKTISATEKSVFSTRNLTLLAWLSFAVLIGRSWQHLFFDIPIREFLWDEDLMQGIVEGLLGWKWEDYITNLAFENTIQNFVRITGIFYLLGAIVSLLVLRYTKKWIGFVLVLSCISLVFLAFLYWKNKYWHFGQFIEYSLQFGTPFFLYLAFFTKITAQRLILLMKIAIAATFIGHGLYALGFYPMPYTFIEMMIHVFHLSESSTRLLLKIAGIIDIVAAVAIFIPKLQKPFLWYCVIWGTLTACARIVGNFYIEIPLESLHQWLHATIYRLPHGGIPLFVLWNLSVNKVNLSK